MLVYFFDENTKEFTYSDLIEDGTQLPENATSIAPINADGTGMYAPTWNGTNWVSMSQEDYQAKFEQSQKPEDAVEITNDQKQQAQYILELTKMKMEMAKMKANIEANANTAATLTKQLIQTTMKTKEVQ